MVRTGQEVGLLLGLWPQSRVFSCHCDEKAPVLMKCSVIQLSPSPSPQDLLRSLTTVSHPTGSPNLSPNPMSPAHNNLGE
jgi:hypothetical protein